MTAIILPELSEQHAELVQSFVLETRIQANVPALDPVEYAEAASSE